jgi:hypothetical protein
LVGFVPSILRLTDCEMAINVFDRVLILIRELFFFPIDTKGASSMFTCLKPAG